MSPTLPGESLTRSVEPAPIVRRGTIGLGVAGAALTLFALIGPAQAGAVHVAGVPASVRLLLVMALLAVALIVACSPSRADRVELAATGLVALGTLSALALAAQPLLIAILLLLLVVLQALRGAGVFATHVRARATGAFLLGVGAMLLGVSGHPPLQQLGVLGLVLGLIAIAGLFPLVRPVDVRARPSMSEMGWLGFVAPVLAIILEQSIVRHLTTSTSAVVAALGVGLGLLNLGWGVFGAWRTRDDLVAWRYSFVADWGLVLLGLGMLAADGSGLQGAVLILVQLVGVRLPLFVFAQRRLLHGGRPRGTPFGILVGGAAAGLPPFAGFMARVYLVRASMELSWTLAVLMLIGLALWGLHGIRLGRTLGVVSGRGAVGVTIVLALSVALGLVPWAVLRLAGM
jgi:hypothetical protein